MKSQHALLSLPRSVRSVLSLSLVACTLLPAAPAAAAGLFLAPRGVRPLAQAGSFIAGADDLNALSYNPAGLSSASNTLQLDAALPMHGSSYTRTDSGYDSTVQGQGLGLPSPTLGVVHDLGWVEGLRFGLGLTADYPMLQNWPSTAADPYAPQRYAVGDYRGTVLSKIIAGAGYRVNEWLSVGASLQVLAGNFTAVNTVSTCDGVVCTQPENPAYDATIQMRAQGIVVPGAQLGVQIRPTDWLGIGLAWESGYRINADATFAMRMPTAAAYSGAELSPNAPKGKVSMRLPQQLRAGVQLLPTADARVELAYVYEPWSVHNSIDIELNNAQMKNMLALGDYSMGAMSLQRGFRDTWSVRLGGEYKPPMRDKPLTLRAGAMYEPSAIPQNMLTPMVVDLNKVLGAVGAQYSFAGLHVEATYAHVFMLSQTVTNSQVLQANPTRPAAPGLATAVGNGTYTASADVFGVGVRVDI